MKGITRGLESVESRSSPSEFPLTMSLALSCRGSHPWEGLVPGIDYVRHSRSENGNWNTIQMIFCAKLQSSITINPIPKRLKYENTFCYVSMSIDYKAIYSNKVAMNYQLYINGAEHGDWRIDGRGSGWEGRLCEWKTKLCLFKIVKITMKVLASSHSRY